MGHRLFCFATCASNSSGVTPYWPLYQFSRPKPGCRSRYRLNRSFDFSVPRYFSCLRFELSFPASLCWYRFRVSLMDSLFSDSCPYSRTLSGCAAFQRSWYSFCFCGSLYGMIASKTHSKQHQETCQAKSSKFVKPLKLHLLRA